MRQEVDSGYLWSPVAETNGVKSRLYDNMRRAAPGYSSVSYAADSEPACPAAAPRPATMQPERIPL
jgi:hypothetical protein